MSVMCGRCVKMIADLPIANAYNVVLVLYLFYLIMLFAHDTPNFILHHFDWRRFFSLFQLLFERNGSINQPINQFPLVDFIAIRCFFSINNNKVD